MTVDAVNRGTAQALLSNEKIVPITHWFDIDGGECDPAEAVRCVCGSDDDGWFSVELKFYDALVN